MLLHLKEAYPTGKNYILTQNTETNDSMLAINKKLGFKQIREEIMFQMSIEQLEQYIKG